MAAFNPNNPLHLVKLQGKAFITFVGLQHLLQDRRLTLVGTDSEVLQYPTKENEYQCVVRGRVLCRYDDDPEDLREFTGLGDASPANVGRSIAPHLIRMAETRALARALRLATRSEYTAREEI